jgi:hypothetical protein
MPIFSPQLIDRITKYFKHKYQVTLTPGEAELYLDSLGSLFLAVYRGRAGRAMPGPLGAAETGQPAGDAVGGRRPP